MYYHGNPTPPAFRLGRSVNGMATFKVTGNLCFEVEAENEEEAKNKAVTEELGDYLKHHELSELLVAEKLEE